MRLASFTLPEIQRITASDDMELGKLGERKQAIFCIIPDSNDASLNFLVGMLYTQAFQELYYQADKIHQGALPVPVRLMFDEFANVALPDGYARLQATMRSRNIMSTIILQNISQLKALFKDEWESIIGNADSFVYLGGNEQSTHKYISELLGKETIDTRTSSQSKGRNGSFSQNFQQTGRELMTPDEVRRLDNKNAIVLIRGEKPVIDEKYDILKHPNIHRTEDGGAPPSSVRWIFGCFRMSYFSSMTGFSPRIRTIAFLLSKRRTSSGVISSRPVCWKFCEKEPFRPLLWLDVRVSIVSFPSSSEIYLCVDCSLPPKYTKLSALPMMLSHSSLKSAFSCEMFCRMIVDIMFRERIVACNRA